MSDTLSHAHPDAGSPSITGRKRHALIGFGGLGTLAAVFTFLFPALDRMNGATALSSDGTSGTAIAYGAVVLGTLSAAAFASGLFQTWSPGAILGLFGQIGGSMLLAMVIAPALLHSDVSDAPVLSGSPVVGATLSTTSGTWVESYFDVLHPKPVDLTTDAKTQVSWQRCVSLATSTCTAIAGAATPLYAVMPADAGHVLRAQVSREGTVAWSAGLRIPAAPPSTPNP